MTMKPKVRTVFGRPAEEGYQYPAQYKKHDSYKTIIHLHKIERQLRKEIDHEQVVHWSKEQIEAVYGA